MAVFLAGVALTIFKAVAISVSTSDDLEEQWTQSMVTSLRQQRPDKNVMIVHVPHVQSFTNAEHIHWELELTPLGPGSSNGGHQGGGRPPPGHGPERAPIQGPVTSGPTQGYEIYLFDSGEFFREGDGGFANWCFGGNFKRVPGHENNVVFFPIENHAPPRPMPATINPNPPTPIRSHPDGCYFVNCQRGNEISSGVAYYRNLDPGLNDGQQPDAYVNVSVGSYTTWESAGVATFADGNKVYWSIGGLSADKPPNSDCGTADNSSHPWDVYKDRERVLYEINGWQCSTVYWCF